MGDNGYRHWVSPQRNHIEDSPPLKQLDLRPALPPWRPPSGWRLWETRLNWLMFWTVVGLCAYVDITTPGGWP